MNADEALRWLDEKDEYYITEDEYEEHFAEMDLNLVGITMQGTPEGEVKIPKRDIRHAIVYGQPLD